MTNSHRERLRVLDEIVKVCDTNQWTYDTPDLANRIHFVATRMGFAPSTVKGLTYTIVEVLRVKKGDKSLGQQRAQIPNPQSTRKEGS